MTKRDRTKERVFAQAREAKPLKALLTTSTGVRGVIDPLR
jgi:hypothetical protein